LKINFQFQLLRFISLSVILFFFSFSFSLSLRLFPVSIWGLIIQPRSCDSQRYISLHPSVSFLVNVFMNLSAPTESGFTTFHFANQSTRAAFLITLNTRIQKGTKKKEKIKKKRRKKRYGNENKE